LKLVVEPSDSGSDSSVIVVSDSDDDDDDDDELECFSSVERSVSAAERQQCCDADEYAVAVAAVFLNTASKTGQIHGGSRDSNVRKLPPDEVDEDMKASGNNSDGNLTETVSIDLTTVVSSAESSAECVTCTVQQNVSDSEPLQSAHTDLQLALSATETNEEVELPDCIAREMTEGFDSAVYNELTDCLDPIELLSLDKCEMLNSICNSSFLGDLSFIDECLVEDCGSSQLLACSAADDSLLKADVEAVAAAAGGQSSSVNKCTSEITASHDIASHLFPADERSADLLQVSSCADDGDDACCQQYSCTSTNSSDVFDCEHACQSASHVDSSCEFTSVSASCNATSSHTDEDSTSERQQAANSCSPSSLVQSVQLDVNGNELCKPTGSDTIVCNDHTSLLLNSHVKVASGSVHGSCNMLTTDSENLLSTGTHKRPLPDECSGVVCKRFRAGSDCLDGELLTRFDSCTDVHETLTHSSDTAVDSAASYIHSAVSSSHDADVCKPNLVELQHICCCCCKLPCDVSSVSYCTDGHACCITCLQQQVKSLLSSPSKA